MKIPNIVAPATVAGLDWSQKDAYTAGTLVS